MPRSDQSGCRAGFNCACLRANEVSRCMLYDTIEVFPADSCCEHWHC
jgi:hypothetical protein